MRRKKVKQRRLLVTPTRDHVGAMYQAAIAAGLEQAYLIVLLLSRLGLREAELVGQRPEDAICRCSNCKQAKPNPEHARKPLPGLRVCDINFASSEAKIYGKGWSTGDAPARILPVESKETGCKADVLGVIRSYIEANHLSAEDKLVPLSTRRIRQIVKEIAILANIPHASLLSPHRLRAFYITEIEEKHGIKVAQVAAGHASISTTQRYCTVRSERLRNAIRTTFGKEEEPQTSATPRLKSGAASG